MRRRRIHHGSLSLPWWRPSSIIEAIVGLLRARSTVKGVWIHIDGIVRRLQLAGLSSILIPVPVMLVVLSVLCRRLWLSSPLLTISGI